MTAIALSSLARVGLGIAALGTAVAGATALVIFCDRYTQFDSKKDHPARSREKVLGMLGAAPAGVSLFYATALMGRVAILGTGSLALKIPLLIASLGYLIILSLNYTKRA